MKKIEFDELQQSRRYKYGYQSFMLLAILILIDTVLYSMKVIWAPHPTNTFIVLLVGFTYFISRCILGDALVGPKENPKKMSIKWACAALFAAVIAILIMGYMVSHRSVVSSANNDGSIMGVVCLGMWVVLGMVYLIKQIRGRKTEK